MINVSQSPTDPDFVQNPYLFYERMRKASPVCLWDDYNMQAVFAHDMVSALLKDRRLGREKPDHLKTDIPEHLAPFYDVEAHSMLELEPPRHTRLRGLVLRAFTSRRIESLAQDIESLAHDLIDACPKDSFDLLPHFASKLPVIVIARLLGVSEEMSDHLLKWSNDMVMMYQARRTRTHEDQAVRSTQEFVAFMRKYVDEKRKRPADDLITHLIAAEQDGERLSTDELITTCILLLNAGHEATVHTFGNGVKTLLEAEQPIPDFNIPEQAARTVEEILRYDPPLHIFTRYVYEDVALGGHLFEKGQEIALVLGATGRDETVWEQAERFDPTRPIKKNTAFGGGLHFCVGAPLARLELMVGLRVLFERFPSLRLAASPKYANIYHFHGLDSLPVEV